MDQELESVFKAVDFNNEEKNFLVLIKSLHRKLRDYTYKSYKRINPVYEDFFSWADRGTFWAGKPSGITIYNSTTVVGDVEIGEKTWIGPFCSIDGTGGLVIGRHCSISAGCQIVSHDTVKYALSGGVLPYEYAPIRIGDNCFVGSHAIITKGVTIGDRCLIAAGAVIVSDVPSNTIVGGVPARTIGKVISDPNGNVVLEYFRH